MASAPQQKMDKGADLPPTYYESVGMAGAPPPPPGFIGAVPHQHGGKKIDYVYL